MALTHWQKLSEKLAFKGFRSILKKTFRLPNGIVTDFDIVESGSFVSIAAFTPKHEAILVRQYRPGPEEILLSVPEGYIDPGEAAEVSVRRELLEETGYSAGEVHFLKAVPSAYRQSVKYCYLATGCVPIGAQSLGEHEFIEIDIVPLDAFRKLIADSKSTNFTSIDISFLALAHLNLL